MDAELDLYIYIEHMSQEHVDIVTNHWHAQFQRRVASFRVNEADGTAQPYGFFRESWHDLPQELFNPETGETVARENGELFLQTLPKAMSGSMVFATEPHDESKCPFKNNEPLPFMRSAKLCTDDA